MPQKNSGIPSGRFLEPSRIAKPGSSISHPSYYGINDFKIGNIIIGLLTVQHLQNWTRPGLHGLDHLSATWTTCWQLASVPVSHRGRVRGVPGQTTSFQSCLPVFYRFSDKSGLSNLELIGSVIRKQPISIGYIISFR